LGEMILFFALLFLFTFLIAMAVQEHHEKS
jgi:hypothetical protein